MPVKDRLEAKSSKRAIFASRRGASSTTRSSSSRRSWTALMQFSGQRRHRSRLTAIRSRPPAAGRLRSATTPASSSATNPTISASQPLAECAACRQTVCEATTDARSAPGFLRARCPGLGVRMGSMNVLADRQTWGITAYHGLKQIYRQTPHCGRQPGWRVRQRWRESKAVASDLVRSLWFRPPQHHLQSWVALLRV